MFYISLSTTVLFICWFRFTTQRDESLISHSLVTTRGAGVQWKKSWNTQLVCKRQTMRRPLFILWCGLTGLSQDNESAALHLDLFFFHFFFLHTVVKSCCLTVTGAKPGEGGEDPRSRRCRGVSLQWFDEGDTRPACSASLTAVVRSRG